MPDETTSETTPKETETDSTTDNTIAEESDVEPTSEEIVRPFAEAKMATAADLSLKNMSRLIHSTRPTIQALFQQLVGNQLVISKSSTIKEINREVALNGMGKLLGMVIR